MPNATRRVASMDELTSALGPAQPGGRAVILIGGADLTEHRRRVELRSFFGALAGYCQRTATTVIDGGTNTGVMRLIAEARSTLGGSFGLIGVAPGGAFDRTTRTGAPIELAPNHDLVLLVPGSRFGEETPWLFAAADHLANGSAPTIVVNGGHLTFEEANLRLAAGHQVIAVEGSGRAADELVADEGLRASGKLRVIPLAVDDASLAASIESETEP
jgi:predicted Rossmann-fold nucleotide-binding protein